MAQEQFAGPEQYTEFDPEKFIRDMKIQAEEKGKIDGLLPEGKAAETKDADAADEDTGAETSSQVSEASSKSTHSGE
ncbi:hypothetical protein CGLAUT_08630 [Corynebacterium glaucum]|uniref:hypothetical protein n=1 Tax=Corynebacterium glaucum TaxID=187491 RepID=UPI0025B2D27F|nr:hypothetical protein [Corynebacterium glaucum]WJZ08207.1 hypothetical protein CGLAUT_08630 [Corynebacterium glaucum]